MFLCIWKIFYEIFIQALLSTALENALLHVSRRFVREPMCSIPVSALSLQVTKESCFSRGKMALLVPLEMKIPLGAHGK